MQTLPNRFQNAQYPGIHLGNEERTLLAKRENIKFTSWTIIRIQIKRGPSIRLMPGF